jgi:hypothetical protein
MVELNDIAKKYKQYFCKAFQENDDLYIEKYNKIEEYITDNIINILPLEEQCKIRYLIPGLSNEEIDKRIEYINDIINNSIFENCDI